MTPQLNIGLREWQRVRIVCTANSFMECAGVQHDSVANVKPREERSKWLQAKSIPKQSPKPIGRPKESTVSKG